MFRTNFESRVAVQLLALFFFSWSSMKYFQRTENMIPYIPSGKVTRILTSFPNSVSIENKYRKIRKFGPINGIRR